jgi:hypothetical protein
MQRYARELKQQIIQLRTEGLTYTEICEHIGQQIPKGTLSYICKRAVLGPAQLERLSLIKRDRMKHNQLIAVAANKRLFADKLVAYREANLDIKPFMSDRRAKLIALAMLYWGEGAKWKGKRGLMLGSSDPKIIQTYIGLLRDCYDIPLDALKGRIQHRADQDPDALIAYWSDSSGIKKENFYPCYVDKRTVGKTTQHLDYKGVLSVTCAGTHIQLELEQIAGIICEVF